MSEFHNHNLVKSASYLSVMIAIIIVSTKIYGWLITDSQAIFASLVDSLLDISSSLINLIAIRFSLQPPDNNHRFGHEKFQDLAVFAQSIFFFVSSLLTFSSSFKALFTESVIHNPVYGINSMYFCIFCTILLLGYQSYVIKKTNSKIIAVDKMHYFTDLLSNIIVVVSVNLSSKFWFIDPISGVIISVYIIYGAYSFFRQALKNLADEEFPEQDKQKILTTISKYKQVIGVHELKTRYAANKPFIQFHLEMDGAMSLNEAHTISEKIINELLIEFPSGEITIHQDPAGVEENVNYREQI